MQKPLIGMVFFALCVLFIYIVGSLLAYPVARTLALFTEASFAKTTHYTIFMFGLACSLLYLRLQTTNVMSGLGFTDKLTVSLRKCSLGILQGVLIFVSLQCVLFALGVFQFKPSITFDISWLLEIFAKGLVVGLLVSVAEESIFRGALLSGLQASCHKWLAIVVCSLLFAAVHFVEYRELDLAEPLRLYTGTQLLLDGLWQFTNTAFIAQFITLFWLGCFLCVVRVTTGELMSCIGIHAGLVASVKLANKVISYQPEAHYSYLAASLDGTYGILPSLLFFLLSVIYMKKRV